MHLTWRWQVLMESVPCTGLALAVGVATAQLHGAMDV
jgi:hypothetical protein